MDIGATKMVVAVQIIKRHHIKGFKRNATVGRRGDITERALKEMPQSDVGATSQKGLEKKCHSWTSGRHHRKGFYRKVKYNNATVGCLSDIAERAFIHK